MLFRSVLRKFSTGSTAGGSVIGATKQGLTPTGKLLDAQLSGRISELYALSGGEGKAKSAKVILGAGPGSLEKLCVVGLGEKEEDVKAATIREGVASACKALHDTGVRGEVAVEAFSELGGTRAAAEGAKEGLYWFEEFKKEKKGSNLTPVLMGDSPRESGEWEYGIVAGEAQNWAKTAANTPANHLTPTLFAERAEKLLSSCSRTQLKVLDVSPESFPCVHAVGKGSKENPLVLHFSYRGSSSEDAPKLCLIGKGVTFDAGGISLKPAAGMGQMRADMGGAAVVVASLSALSNLSVDVNLDVLVPLCENLPSSTALKPGDVITALDGTTIEVDNTDAEGRLILADCLTYAKSNIEPQVTVDVATLTGAMVVALGPVMTGAFTPNDELWSLLESAGEDSGDPFWRMPLDQKYSEMLKSKLADLKNVGGRDAGACTAAAFLQHFASTDNWIHLDIAGTMMSDTMTGRPTRGLVRFVEKWAENNK